MLLVCLFARNLFVPSCCRCCCYRCCCCYHCCCHCHCCCCCRCCSFCLCFFPCWNHWHQFWIRQAASVLHSAFRRISHTQKTHIKEKRSWENLWKSENAMPGTKFLMENSCKRGEKKKRLHYLTSSCSSTISAAASSSVAFAPAMTAPKQIKNCQHAWQDELGRKQGVQGNGGRGLSWTSCSITANKSPD